MMSGLACSWSMHLLPRAKHSEHTSGLSGWKMHLILRRRPALLLENLRKQEESEKSNKTRIKGSRRKDGCEQGNTQVDWCRSVVKQYHVKVAIGSSGNRVDLHSKQLCVPLRIFLRVGNDSSLGMLRVCCVSHSHGWWCLVPVRSSSEHGAVLEASPADEGLWIYNRDAT